MIYSNLASGRIFNVPLLLLLALLLALFTSSAATAALDISESHQNISSQVLYYEDFDSLKTADNLFLMADREFSQSVAEQSVNFGYTKSTFWLKLTLTNSSPIALTNYLEVGYAILDEVTFYIRKEREKRETFETGDQKNFAQRPYPHTTFALPITLHAGQKAEVLIRLRSSSSLQAPLWLWQQDEFSHHALKQTLIKGLFLGCLLGMVFYHVLLYLNLRKKQHIFYAGYVLSTALLISTLEGLSYQYLWPKSPWWNHNSIIFFMGCIYIFAGLFVADFLRVRETQWHARLLNLFITIALVVVIASLVLPYSISIQLALFDTLLGFILVIWFGISRSLEGDIPARYFTLSFFFLVIGGILLTANKTAIIPRTSITESAFIVGAALQVVLLSLAMVDRLNREKQGRLDTQVEFLRQERELIESQQLALLNERKANEAQRNDIVVQQRTNEILEQKVEKRSVQLEEANRKLKEIATMDNLTGVRNRKHLDEIFHAECKRAQRHHHTLSVIMIDIDNFNVVSDEYGHVISDRCLIALARQLKKSSNRASDVISRYGSQEFCILLPNTAENDAAELAETIRRNVANMTTSVNNISIKLTISLGVASALPATVADGFHLIDFADKALAVSKRLGRNRVTLWSSLKA